MGSVLVTGSAGFIGRHAVKMFEAQGHHVTAIDIRAGMDCRKVFDTNARWDVVAHFAAIVGGRANIDGNPLAVAESMALDVAMFSHALRTKPAHVVYPSSSAAYPIMWQGGECPPIRLKERLIDLHQPALPDAMYGWVKLTGEQLAHRARQAGVNVHVIRPMSGYGPDQDQSYPFGAFLARARAKADPFDIWGDGTQVRDWVHVDDVMATIAAVIDQDHQQPVNVGTGIATSFIELAGLFAAVGGYSPTIRTNPDKPTGVAWRVADCTEMHRLHVPTIGIAEGIERALRA